MDWSLEDVQKELTMFKSLAKMWLETKGVPYHKHYMFILQLLGKEVLCHWKSFPINAPNNDKEQPGCKWEAFKAPLGKHQVLKGKGADHKQLPPAGKMNS